MARQLLRANPFQVGLAAVLLATLCYAGIAADKPAWVRELDNRLLAAMFRWRPAQAAAAPIVIVDIDEASLLRYGPWPWTRRQLAELVETIARQQPRAIGFDLPMPEAEWPLPGALLERLQPFFAGDPAGIEVVQRAVAALDRDHDRQFRALIDQTPTVLGYLLVCADDGLKSPAAMSRPPWRWRLDPPVARLEQLPLPSAYRVRGPLPTASPGGSAGFFNLFPEDSGAVRQLPLLLTLDGLPYPALALEMARIGLGDDGLTLHAGPRDGAERRPLLGISVGGRFIPTDGVGRMVINWRAGQDSYPRLSAAELLDGTAALSLAGRYVLVGASALGREELRATAFAEGLPTVQIHANALDNLLTGDPLRHSLFIEVIVSLSVMISGGLLICLLLTLFKALSGLLGTTAVLTLVVAGNYLLLFRNGSHVGLGFPLAALLGIALVVALARYLLIEREKRFVQGAFRHYLAPQLVEELLRHPERLSLAGEEKELTVLFCDIRDFAGISEGLDTVVLAGLMNRFLTEMAALVTAGSGMVNKFIGDALMAIWGAPLDDAEHARQAVRTALAMQRRMEELRREWRKEGLPEIEIGIGINTGWMRVGNFGSRELFDYTVIGDQVNLASRLEGLTKVYGTGILISQATRDALNGEIDCRPVDLVRVKGKERPVQIFEPLAADAATAGENRRWEGALCSYRQGRFEEAAQVLHELEREQSRPLYRLYLSRIEHFRRRPPPAGWDGIHCHDSK